MKLENKTYILKSDISEELDIYSYNTLTGEVERKSGWKGTSFLTTVPEGMTYGSRKPIVIPFFDILGTVEIVMFDKDYNFIASTTTQANSLNTCELDVRTYRIGLNFQIGGDYNKDIKRQWFYCGYPVEAHYSKLEKKLSRENGQVFFREKINGNITLVGQDFEYIRTANLEQNLLFAFYTNSVLQAKSTFNKTDCKFDYFKKSVSLKLNPVDNYTGILDKYENSYDLIKLAPAISKLTLTKRLAYQIYIQGANDITTIANGVYWQDDVNEVVDDENKLINKYYFGKIHDFREIHLGGLEAPVNGTFIQDAQSDSWKSKAYTSTGEDTNGYCDIYFEKYYSAGDIVTDEDISEILIRRARKFSNGDAIDSSEIYNASKRALVDLYKIYLRFSEDMEFEDTSIYGISVSWYVIDDVNNGFLMKGAQYKYEMYVLTDTPYNFFLGENIIDYNIFARIIADIDSVEIGGQTRVLYDLPYDDFTYTRANYKKCIGIEVSDYWKIYQEKAELSEPTKYGVDDYGKYFSSNFATLTTLDNKPMPISRSSWANTSLWFVFKEEYWLSEYENKYRVEYELKDAYNIADVIKVILAQINPNLKHEATSEYSEILYGNSTELSFGENALFISPKSNVLKGNYDQAAQKAEITFKQLMEMLRDCFRCYWFIDNENRFRIEHISYFMNGMSYSQPTSYLDLTVPTDKFNKKKILYGQEEIEFEKSELVSRFEFSWSDDSTDVFGNNTIDINSQYVQKDRVENITPDLFSSDIDFMLFAPDKFSNDGFALIIANKETKKVPIVEQSIFMDSEYIYQYKASVQNWYASWLYLIKYYMYDMPAQEIECSGIYSQPVVQGIKKCMKNNISFQISPMDKISEFSMIKTEIGNGMIDEITTNLDTGLNDIKVAYTPI